MDSEKADTMTLRDYMAVAAPALVAGAAHGGRRYRLGLVLLVAPDATLPSVH